MMVSPCCAYYGWLEILKQLPRLRHGLKNSYVATSTAIMRPRSGLQKFLVADPGRREKKKKKKKEKKENKKEKERGERKQKKKEKEKKKKDPASDNVLPAITAKLLADPEGDRTGARTASGENCGMKFPAM